MEMIVGLASTASDVADFADVAESETDVHGWNREVGGDHFGLVAEKEGTNRDDRGSWHEQPTK